MSSRQPSYLLGLLLVAIVASAPHLSVVTGFGYLIFGGPKWALPVVVFSVLKSIPIFGERSLDGFRLMMSPFWEDRFLYHKEDLNAYFDEPIESTYAAIDPETGKSHAVEFEGPRGDGFFPTAYGDRLWLVHPIRNSTDSCEIRGGHAQKSKFTDSFLTAATNQRRFLLEGQPAYLDERSNGFVVSVFAEDEWKNKYSVLLPDLDQKWTFGTTQTSLSSTNSLQCVSRENETHVLLAAGQHLLYRHEIELEPLSESDQKQVLLGTLTSGPASAIRPCNTDAQLAGWSLVRESGVDASSHLMFVHGQPAVLIVEDIGTSGSFGRVYRFDGKEWTEFATHPFPFARTVRVVSCRDGMKSYIITTTPFDVSRVYAVEQSGIRATQCVVDEIPICVLLIVLMPLMGSLISAVMLIIGGSILMSWHTKPDYGFGNQTVRLASLWQRGMARLIDLSLITGLVLILGWFLTLRLDWQLLVDAAFVEFDHPDVRIFVSALKVILLSLSATAVVVVAMQGRWGVTPGKWCIGIRTLRSTLRPCGFTRSLVREVMICVDSCNCLWWIPGVLSIALTNCRQRLGDRVGDTIVVEARSLPSKR